jgi:hypothetical protein
MWSFFVVIAVFNAILECDYGSVGQNKKFSRRESPSFQDFQIISKKVLTYYQKDNIISSTGTYYQNDNNKNGGIQHEKDISSSRYAERFY